jgi:hypothetical protein
VQDEEDERIWSSPKKAKPARSAEDDLRVDPSAGHVDPDTLQRMMNKQRSQQNALSFLKLNVWDLSV